MSRHCVNLRNHTAIIRDNVAVVEITQWSEKSHVMGTVHLTLKDFIKIGQKFSKICAANSTHNREEASHES